MMRHICYMHDFGAVLQNLYKDRRITRRGENSHSYERVDGTETSLQRSATAKQMLLSASLAAAARRHPSSQS